MGSVSYHRPSAPQGRNRPWLALDYSYELEGKDGVKQFVRISVHQRRKKEEAEAFLGVRPHWWDPTQKFEAEIAPTVMEVSQDSNGSPTKISPVKKKQKLEGFDPSKPGPGQYPLINLGGSGDCGWGDVYHSLWLLQTPDAGKMHLPKRRSSSRKSRKWLDSCALRRYIAF